MSTIKIKYFWALPTTRVVVMGVLNLCRVGWTTVNPDAVAAGEWVTWRKCLRVHPWPTDGEDTVVAGHPGGRIVWVIGMNEDGRATDFV